MKIVGFDINASHEEHFILTNIQPIYEGLISHCATYNSAKGFYHSVAFDYLDKSYRFIKITPGNVIIDVLKVLNTKAKSVTFIGLAGSLHSKYKIGDIVLPRFVSNYTSLKSKKVLNKHEISPIRICQVNGLVQHVSFYTKLLSRGIDLVDMESYYLTCHTTKKAVLQFIGIVSDMPLSMPFYKDIDVKIDYKTLFQYL